MKLVVIGLGEFGVVERRILFSNGIYFVDRRLLSIYCVDFEVLG